MWESLDKSPLITRYGAGRRLLTALGLTRAPHPVHWVIQELWTLKHTGGSLKALGEPRDAG